MNIPLIKTPRSADISITGRCNLRCKYCSHFTSAGDSGTDLPKEEWLKFFRELNKCAVFKVTLEGGEPFFREDLKELINGIVQNRMRFSILSNGTLITEKMASFLASTGRCDGVQVSIDGSTPVTHDVFRGKGTFSGAIRGVKHLQKHNVPVSVRVTIHRNNVRDLDGIAALLLDDIGLETFSTNSASYMGLCRQNSGIVQLTVKERSIAMEDLLRINKKYNGRISATAGPLAEALTWLEMEKARRSGKKRLPDKGYLTGCGGPMYTIAIRSDGVIIPCIQMSHIQLGRINRDDLSEVWQNHPELNRLRQRCNIPLKDFEFCRDCDYIDYCTGNCPALAYIITDNENHPSPDACLKKFLQDGGRLPNEDLL
jgi:SynChlorMet cassette radical SAM/SPASM protein ScmE